MDNERLKKTLNTVFLVLLAACLLAGLAVMLFFPHDENKYENRYAVGGDHDPVPVTFAAYLDGSFQDAVENAFADQLPFAEAMKKTYNDTSSRLTAKLLPVLLRAKANDPVNDPSNDPAGNPANLPPADDPDPPGPGPVDPEKHLPLPEVAEEPRVYTDEKTADGRINLANMDPAAEVPVYVALSNDVFLFRSHLVYGQQYLMYAQTAFDDRAANVNATVASHPGLDYYAYYIEKESDIDLATGTKSEMSDYVMGLLDIPAEQKNIFRVNSYEEFDGYYYKVDHHWNGFGSYEGYRQILAMLLPDEEPVLPVALRNGGLLTGSKTVGSAAVYTEDLRAYEFDFPEFTYEVNGQLTTAYGFLANYLATEAANPGGGAGTNYANCYGYDNGVTVIRNASSDGGNVLLIGESYDNAVLKLLACHFSEVHAIDLRNHEAQLGVPFRFGEYVETHAISKVLFVGSTEYWYGPSFNLTE